MSAKPTTRPARVLHDLAAAVPWWAWVGAAAVLHALLHLVAEPQTAGPGRAVDPGGFAAAGWWLALTNVLQYLVPALCIVAAVVLPRRRAERDQTALANDPNAAPPIESMAWREFEPLVVQAFRLQGFQVSEATGGTDAGTDLLLRKERQSFLVHCKQWRAARVEVPVVQSVHAAMQARGAAGGFVLAAGRFSREAVSFAGGVNIRLIDGPALQALVQQAFVRTGRVAPAPAPAPAPEAREPALAGAPVKSATPPSPDPAPSGELVLPCPLCGNGMVKRLAKRGVHAGQYFWGCSKHPECKGTRRLRAG